MSFPRSRSTTSVASRPVQRPLSRASTTSIQSINHHDQAYNPGQHYEHLTPQPDHPVSYQNHAPIYSSMPEPTALLQAAQHLAHADSVFVDQGIASSAMANPTYNLDITSQQFQDIMRRSAPIQAPDAVAGMQGSFVTAPSGTEGEDKKKKGTNSNATNDKELREMIARNASRSLDDIAQEVLNNEKTPRAEKTKQLFAMKWLKTECKAAKSSVPRSRVYSAYAEKCADTRVVPLNPASFGKLVRVIFPGIQTRRLGVRGESKYHYVDLALVNDPGEERPSTARGMKAPLSRQNSISGNSNFNLPPRLDADSAAFPTNDTGFEAVVAEQKNELTSKGVVFVHPYGQSLPVPSQTYQSTLKFPPLVQELQDQNYAIELPNINPYLPPKTDTDTAMNLFAVYRSHCTSLVDCIRFCKEKQFTRLLQSFQGTLTVPGQKLFAHPSMSAWVKECDYRMYKMMMHFIAPLILQVAPVKVLHFLNHVEKNITPHLAKLFQDQPLHLQDAKLEPATIFAHLLRRMLKANQAAHAAAAIITCPQSVEQMRRDYQNSVNPQRIIESELPACGHEEAYKILTEEVMDLLRIDLSTGLFTTEAILDRLWEFIRSLPSRFPNVEPRTLLHYINSVGCAIIRDITVEQGPSFNAWWVVKMFVDELGLWLASYGGLLAHGRQAESRSPNSMQLDASVNNGLASGSDGGGSRYSSLGADFMQNGSFMTNGSVQTGTHSQSEINNQQFRPAFDTRMSLDFGLGPPQDGQDNDDSGIGMSLVEDSKLVFAPNSVGRGYIENSAVIR